MKLINFFMNTSTKLSLVLFTALALNGCAYGADNEPAAAPTSSAAAAAAAIATTASSADKEKLKKQKKKAREKARAKEAKVKKAKEKEESEAAAAKQKEDRAAELKEILKEQKKNAAARAKLLNPQNTGASQHLADISGNDPAFQAVADAAGKKRGHNLEHVNSLVKNTAASVANDPSFTGRSMHRITAANRLDD